MNLLVVCLMLGIGSIRADAIENECTSQLVETIPQDLVYNETIITQDTYHQLLNLIRSAKSTIDIASLYWTLQGTDVMPDPVPESHKGEDILNALLYASKQNSIKVRIAVNEDNNTDNSADLAKLEPSVQVRKVNFTRLLGAGVLHTKFVLVDGESFYLGSANMDWRSLTHVKEMGLIMRQCSLLAKELATIFEIYWYLGQNDISIPKSWPQKYWAKYNQTNPLQVNINQQMYEVYLSSSPKELCPTDRTNDIDAILHIINNAEKFIYIAVMDYFPIFLYQYPVKYWPVIDDALRRAAVERAVQVRLLASHWNHTRASMSLFLKSLSALFNTQRQLNGSIEARLFTVPVFNTEESRIPFSRVNHNKYMVTDKVAYIGTSNWSADYFISTGGVGIVLHTKSSNESNVHHQLKSIFERDWNSSYSKQV